MSIAVDPNLQDGGNGYFFRFKNNHDGGVGVDYYDSQGNAITNQQFDSAGAGLTSSQLENAASFGYRSYDDYLLDQGAVTSTGAEDPQIGPTARSQSVLPTTTATDSDTGSVTDEQAYYQDQIDAINRLLGLSDTQLNTGLTNLNNSYGSQKARLSNQKTKTMNAYDLQDTENTQAKERGLGQVDDFVGRSYNSLMRLLSGAGAGVSSVARTVVPTLVSKAGSTRRQNVFDVAGENDRNIDMARADAEEEYTQSFEDLDNWQKGQEKSLREGIYNNTSDLLNRRKNLEIAKQQATGAGYATARDAASGTQAEIDRRMGELNSLFGNFQPTYNARQMNLKAPELGKYTLDEATIEGDKNIPAESRYYMPMMRKRQNQLA